MDCLNTKYKGIHWFNWGKTSDFYSSGHPKHLTGEFDKVFDCFKLFFTIRNLNLNSEQHNGR